MAILLSLSFLTGTSAVRAETILTVNSMNDAVDMNPGDGVCETEAGECTLRAAIQEANAFEGADTISLPQGTITLSIPGMDEDASATGDLDITDELVINGATTLVGERLTTITGGQLDRVFHILPEINVEINHVIITDGKEQGWFGGGGIYNQGNLFLDSSDILENSTGADGGGIRNSGNLSIENSAILKNAATQGGGIFNSGILSAYITNINENISLGPGGGVYNTEEGEVDILWSSVSSNTVTELASGGGIYNLGSFIIGDITRVVMNTANSSGGGIFNAGTMQITGLDILNNSAGITGGALYNTGNVKIESSDFSENTAPMGGAITSEWLYETNPTPPTVTLLNSKVIGNTATDMAGGILSVISTFTIEDTDIRENMADVGGGIATYSGEMTITNTKIEMNTADSLGGGISNLGYLYIYSSTIFNNTAPSGGGVYNKLNSLLSLTDTEITANEAQDGAGFYNEGSLSIYEGTLSYNMAAVGGGGLYNSGGYTEVNRTTFYSNYAQSGGAIWNGESTTPTEEMDAVEQSLGEASSKLSKAMEAQREQASKDSAFKAELTSAIFIVTSTFGINDASGQGGGIYTLDEVQIVSSTFSDNTAGEGDTIFIGAETAEVAIANTILATRDARVNCAGYETIESVGHNLETNNTCQFNTSGDITNTDPLLMIVNLPSGVGLSPRSPAIDAGDNMLCGDMDQNGTERPIDGTGDGQAICDIGSYEAPTPELVFADVPLNYWAYDYIIPLYESGYTSGCATDPQRIFCPENTMNRAESAVFIVRGLHPDEPGYMPPTPTVQYFDDVPVGVDEQWFSKWVGELYEQGYTAGCSEEPPLYCPQNGHTRAEATVFYLRMLKGADYEPPQVTEPPIFNDVPVDEWYAKWVHAAFTEGLIQDCQTDMENMLFRPEEDLARSEAACMMYQAVIAPLVN
jgi:CSLREA domain-containing protein